MTNSIVGEDVVLFINREIASGLRELRAAEKKYGCRYAMRFELNKDGKVQMHLRPADEPGVTA